MPANWKQYAFIGLGCLVAVFLLWVYGGNLRDKFYEAVNDKNVQALLKRIEQKDQANQELQSAIAAKSVEAERAKAEARLQAERAKAAEAQVKTLVQQANQLASQVSLLQQEVARVPDSELRSHIRGAMVRLHTTPSAPGQGQ